MGGWWAYGSTSNNQNNLQAIKNSNATIMILQNAIPTTSNSGLSMGGTKMVYMNGTTDYMSFTAFTANSGGQTLQVGSTATGQGTWCSMHLIAYGPGFTGPQGLTGPQGFTGPQGSTGSSLPFFYQSVSPTASSLTAGSRWFHSDTGVEYVYINDGDSSQWVQPTSTIAGSLNHYTWEILSNTYNITLSSQFGPEYFGVSSSVASYVYLPTNVVVGKSVTVKDESGKASVNNIYIVAYSGESIDNSTQSIINSDYGTKTLLRRNNNWWII
jgi:hypothetical protein